MRRAFVLLAAAALAWPGTGSAKEWITVSTPSGGVTAGAEWHATLTVPLHPRGLTLPRRPELVYTHFDSYRQRRFVAQPTGERGVYRARVVLPDAGRWTVYVYAPEIGAVTPDPHTNTVLVRPAADGDRRRIMAVVAGAAMLCALGLPLVRRRRRGYRHAFGTSR